MRYERVLRLPSGRGETTELDRPDRPAQDGPPPGKAHGSPGSNGVGFASKQGENGRSTPGHGRVHRASLTQAIDHGANAGIPDDDRWLEGRSAAWLAGYAIRAGDPRSESDRPDCPGRTTHTPTPYRHRSLRNRQHDPTSRFQICTSRRSLIPRPVPSARPPVEKIRHVSPNCGRQLLKTFHRGRHDPTVGTSPRSALAASLLPPPKPPAIGIRFVIATATPSGSPRTAHAVPQESWPHPRQDSLHHAARPASGSSPSRVPAGVPL